MALALVLVLAWSAVVSAARFSDYSGAKMPQYETGDEGSDDAESLLEDYHGHSPDASSPLDYKYEEDIKYGKTESLEREAEVETWKKSKGRRRVVIDSQDTHDTEFDNELEADFGRRRPNQNYFQRNPKTKSWNYREDNIAALRKSMRHGRSKNIREPDNNNEDNYVEKKEFRRNKNKEFDDDDDDERYKESTKRVVRRKPRDRVPVRHFNVDLNGDLVPDRRVKNEELDYANVNEERRRRPTLIHSQEDRYRPSIDDEDLRLRKKQNKKIFDEDGDYYDMKRVENIKSKLPILLQRTSATTFVSTPSSANIIDVLWTYRRAESPSSSSTSHLPPSETTTRSSTAAPTTTLTLNMTKSNNSSQELSLAEKSRLSILKKAQRKESIKIGSSTKKPPVLLQVTVKIPTVVMVEPPSSEVILPRAREFSEDTPERLNRAKHLMRKKLIARAKNIQDLTDNWDEVVCDYIDVALLDCAPNTCINILFTILPPLVLFLF
ncbi:uncharacterized protein LOC101742534 [Bombyx mori]|uniref:Uncharacterized protein n=1 Tax=Bombyx mori TaxID=7091 RepID=A0A8R2AM15_BOMMO|nr:uncharacterized protein LOC101742534 isoform X1 [Bombyx mori]